MGANDLGALCGKLKAIAINKYRLEWKMPVIITISTIRQRLYYCSTGSWVALMQSRP